MEIEDTSTAFLADGKSGAKDVTIEDAVAAMKEVAGIEGITIENFNSKNKEQKVKVKVGSVTKEAKVVLTLVPNSKNSTELSFTGNTVDLKFNVFANGKTADYSYTELTTATDSSIDINKINVTENKITVQEGLLSSEKWTEIKKNGQPLRAYRVTVKDSTGKIGKIAMYENGKAVIEEK